MSSDEILLEKFVSHYQWVMEAASNIKILQSIELLGEKKRPV